MPPDQLSVTLMRLLFLDEYSMIRSGAAATLPLLEDATTMTASASKAGSTGGRETAMIDAAALFGRKRLVAVV